MKKASRRIASVDISILSEIIQGEGIGKDLDDLNFSPLFLSNDWLEKVFGLESRFMATNNMMISTSLRNGLKVHGQRGQFSIGVIIREKCISNGLPSSYSRKPPNLFVKELMDYCFLLMRDMITFNE